MSRVQQAILQVNHCLRQASNCPGPGIEAARAAYWSSEGCLANGRAGIQVFSSAVLLFLTVDVALFSHKKIIGLWRNFFTLANESFLKTPDEPSAMLTKRWDTELSGRELVSIKFLKINKGYFSMKSALSSHWLHRKNWVTTSNRFTPIEGSPDALYTKQSTKNSGMARNRTLSFALTG